MRFLSALLIASSNFLLQESVNNVMTISRKVFFIKCKIRFSNAISVCKNSFFLSTELLLRYFNAPLAHFDTRVKKIQSRSYCFES